MNADDVLADYRRWLYRVANDLLGPEHPDVDDLAQEGYIAMWRALGTFDSAKGSLPSWLTLNARTRMQECVQRGHWFGAPSRRGKRPNQAVVVSLDALPVEVAVSADLEGVELAYHQGELVAAIDALTPSQRRYVIARFWGGLTCTQMEKFGVFTNAGGRWEAARAKLAESLAHLA